MNKNTTATKTDQTFAERIADKSKTPLYSMFIEWVRDIAALNSKSEDEIYSMWREHVRQNENMDQSPTTSEFITWNELQGGGMGAC